MGREIAPFICTCCGLQHRVAEQTTGFDLSGPQTKCAECIEHQGADERKQLRRAQEHEEALREAWLTNSDAAQALKKGRDAAFRSRDHAIRLLDAIQGQHHVRGKQGFCKCGVQTCATERLVSDPWVSERIKALLDRDDYRRGYAS
jgi:hypothetical protein